MALAAGEIALSQDERSSPEVALSLLLHRRIGVVISSEQIKRLFDVDFAKLSLLAHAIHDRQIKQEN